jgi:hypothetical protein
MNDNFEKFVDFVKSECKTHKVKIKEYKRKYVKLSDTIKCGGYFDDGTDGKYVTNPTLAYAKGCDSAPELLVHEYCHMTQWLDGMSLWRKANDSLGLVDDWLAGKEVDNIEEHLNNARDLELDNEKRSVEMIKKWNLPIDVDLYTKKANAYVQFYNYMKESRRWSTPGRSPYSVPEVLEVMSDKFDMNYDELTPEIHKVFVEQGI